MKRLPVSFPLGSKFKATLCDFYPHLVVKRYMIIRRILVSVPLNSDFVLTPTVANVVQD